MTELLVCDASAPLQWAGGKQRTPGGNPNPGEVLQDFSRNIACNNEHVMTRLKDYQQNFGVCFFFTIGRRLARTVLSQTEPTSGATTQRAVPRRREEHALRPQILDQT